MSTHFKGARVLQEEWYPIWVNNVSKAAILSDEQTSKIEDDAITLLGEENNVEIARIRWLSRPAATKAYGSMVVYLTKKEHAQRLLDGQLFDINSEAAFTKVFEGRLTPNRCYRCQDYGHLAFRCPSEVPVCGSCAERGHEQILCTSAVIKCAACHGPHKSNDSGCPTFREAMKKISAHHE